MLTDTSSPLGLFQMGVRGFQEQNIVIRAVDIVT
jgi:hypothetical protein